MTRGDIVYVRTDNHITTGYEQTFDRPAIVVSNNKCNTYSPVVEIVYCTTSRTKKHLPTHVPVRIGRQCGIVLCEAVYSVDKCRITRTLGHCTETEIQNINKALKISLDLF